ncbi:hypothetical protein CONPUDRAFT_82451 [Coniophora puteana RWD-64-598 SS2]|uniref:Uncharacterized protein n=1 Tax=Coniophora puteana (strain RWD-64-598) TaxID=741705 RepID=A0A5M3MQY1_CONPW|nr:uncharacterized protein CONPUDRAFT_82451 [Coniophora puteana RWD-64-598 SS2]EIW81582.1 hypothetical protein CONPUDRAFT_82451 [Coniophora puteana RWD-64-598 SS2]
MSNSSKPNSASSSSSSSPHPGIVALPSMTHSLASLPNMSSLPQDMLHYSNGAYSKQKLDQMLARQQHHNFASPPYHSQGYDVERTPSPDDHITVRCRQQQQQQGTAGRR